MPVLGMAERIAHNAAYVQKPPTLKPSVGFFFVGTDTTSPHTGTPEPHAVVLRTGGH